MEYLYYIVIFILLVAVVFCGRRIAQLTHQLHLAEMNVRQLRIKQELTNLLSTLKNRTTNCGFTSDELKTLRFLCHPDRHNNSESSTAITQKINELIKVGK